MILIVTNKIDAHSDIIIQKLHDKEIEFYRFNTEDYPLKYNINVSQTNRKKELTLTTPAHGAIDLTRVDSIWYRRPEDSKIDPVIKDKKLVEFAQNESKKTLMWLWDILEDKFWVNHPRNNIPASSKLRQNEFAKKSGVRIPDSLITNESKKAKEFLRNYEAVATKPISGGFIKRGNKFKYIYTNVITPENAGNIKLVKYCPTLLQEYIPKKFELRITVVGNDIFACKIESQKSEKAKYDWRRYDDDNVPHTSFELPYRIKRFCFNIVNHFNLNFGAIDIIVTPDNDYVFLELNPNGQWGWIESLTGIPISEAVIKTLTEKIKTSSVK